MGFLRRLLGGDDLPPGFGGELAADERVLASAALTSGGHLVVTSWGIWLPEDPPRRVSWHLVSKATWKDGAIVLVEADETETFPGAVVLTDRRPRRLRLSAPGRVPEEIHARVTASIRSRHHRELPGGGAWFVQRKVPGRGGVLLQVRPDPGTDPAAVSQVAATVGAEIADALRGRENP